MRVSVPNIGKLTVQEGEDVGLTWADTDIRVLNKEQPHGH